LPEFPDVTINARIEPIGDTYEVVELSLDGGGSRSPISPALLRQLPLRTLVRLAVGPLLLNWNLRERLIVKEGDEPSSEADLHRRVALSYRVARMIGESPNKAVARNLAVTEATAIRRVRAARAAGALRPDEIAQAGGARSRLED
jgi:hypothetical protein